MTSKRYIQTFADKTKINPLLRCIFRVQNTISQLANSYSYSYWKWVWGFEPEDMQKGG